MNPSSDELDTLEREWANRMWEETEARRKVLEATEAWQNAQQQSKLAEKLLDDARKRYWSRDAKQ